MPTPTLNDVQAVDPVLTNLLVGYMQADNRFVADRVFPGVSVPNDSGTYFIFTQKYWFLDEMKVRAPGNPFPEGDFGVETSTYATLQYALAKRIADETRANSQVPMDLETASLKWLAQQILIRKERAFSTDWMITGVWGTSNSTATDWDDFSSGDPVSDVEVAKRTISVNTGFTPNTLVMGDIVYEALKLHPDIIDRFKYTNAATGSGVRSALGEIFEVTFQVSKASYNSSNEGQTAGYYAIVDDDALLCYVNPTPGILDPSGGYTFNWAPGGGLGIVLPTYRDEFNQADVLRCKMQFDQKAVATGLGYIFLDIV